ncbi:hypothetical protein V3C97_04005 [Ligilactobacillus saerimneri]|uniref:hypothetical protein n=1 Tax=Ligilactobacillus saerimneri TaxID=228229 RepID=UPI0030CD0246
MAQLQAAYDPVDPLPIVSPAPRVTKKADPEGYAKYKAYLEYQEALAEKSAKVSPEETKKWLLEQVETEMVLNALKKALRVRDDGKLEFDYSSEYYNIIVNWYEEKVKEYNVIIASFNAYEERQPQKYRLLLRKLKADPVLLDKI